VPTSALTIGPRLLEPWKPRYTYCCWWCTEHHESTHTIRTHPHARAHTLHTEGRRMVESYSPFNNKLVERKWRRKSHLLIELWTLCTFAGLYTSIYFFS
jgi:hypothetical protein